MAVGIQELASNAWSYIAGQCTAFVATVATWVPAGLGNANTWVERAREKGYAISPVPVAGAVAQYAGAGFSQFGHVALVTSVDPDGQGFNVEEMNFSCGPFCKDTRHSSMNGVVGFILPPGSAPPLPGQGAALAPPFFNLAAAISPGGALLSPLHVPDLQDLFIRAGLIILGLILIVVGISVTFRVPEKAASGAVTVASRGAVAA